MSNVETLHSLSVAPIDEQTDFHGADGRVNAAAITKCGSLDLQPILVGKTITLRPIELNDSEDLYQAASDPLIWELHPDPQRYKREIFQKNFLDAALASKSAFVVIENVSQKIIGSSRYYNLDEKNKEIAIGFTFLARKYWGGATNAEMKRLMLNHAFQYVDTVWFHVGTENWRSRRAMEKIGGKLSHEAAIILNGKASEHAFYKIVAAR